MNNLTPQLFAQTLDIYKRAWETQDSDLIISIFTPDAVYHERLLEAPMSTHEGIQQYWKCKVQENQANIKVRILSKYVDGITGIAEWEAEFDDKEDGCRRFMREIAVMEFKDGKICSLREYWVSKKIGNLQGG